VVPEKGENTQVFLMVEKTPAVLLVALEVVPMELAA
jgi:hypothetical protein